MPSSLGPKRPKLCDIHGENHSKDKKVLCPLKQKEKGTQNRIIDCFFAEEPEMQRVSYRFQIHHEAGANGIILKLGGCNTHNCVTTGKKTRDHF